MPRGRALGYTWQRPTEDRYLMTETELKNRLTVLVGGRVAEMLTFHEVSTGAADDFARRHWRDALGGCVGRGTVAADLLGDGRPQLAAAGWRRGFV